MAGYLPLPALRLLHAATCLQVHRSFTALADMGDELAVSHHCQGCHASNCWGPADGSESPPSAVWSVQGFGGDALPYSPHCWGAVCQWGSS